MEEREEAQGDGRAQLGVRLRAYVVVEEERLGVPDEVAHVVAEGQGEAGVFVGLGVFWLGGGGVSGMGKCGGWTDGWVDVAPLL